MHASWRNKSPPCRALDPLSVRTNIIIFDISALGMGTQAFSDELKRRGILANGINATHMRMVTHLDVTRADCERAADVVAKLAGADITAITV